jgi:hypothetical protein
MAARSRASRSSGTARIRPSGPAVADASRRILAAPSSVFEVYHVTRVPAQTVVVTAPPRTWRRRGCLRCCPLRVRGCWLHPSQRHSIVGHARKARRSTCETSYLVIESIKPRSRLASPKSSTGSPLSFRRPTAVATVLSSLLCGTFPASTYAPVRRKPAAPPAST